MIYSHVYPLLDTSISLRPSSVCNAHGSPPWILKRGGLESSGRIVISFTGKIRRMVFFSVGVGGTPNWIFLKKKSEF